MSKLFKDYDNNTLKEIFDNEKGIQEDIEGMMELSFPSLKPNYNDKLDYFINECRSGAYSHSQYE